MLFEDGRKIIHVFVKCFSAKRHPEGTGASNKRILENLVRLSDVFSGDVIIRIPIIPGFND